MIAFKNLTFTSLWCIQGPEAQSVVPRAGERQEKSPAVTAVHPTCHPTQKREQTESFFSEEECCFISGV